MQNKSEKKKGLEPPPGAEVHEGALAIYWLDESGILYGRSKPTPRTLELQRENLALIREIAGGKKVCLLADITDGAPLDKITRDYLGKEMREVLKAMGCISSSPLGKMIVTIFRSLRNQPVPVKLFGTEAEAKAWLKEQMGGGQG